MADETNVIEYLAAGEATQTEIDDFINWCVVMCIQPGGNGNEKGAVSGVTECGHVCCVIGVRLFQEMESSASKVC